MKNRPDPMDHLRRPALCLAFLFSLLAIPAAQAAPPQLRTQGSEIVTASGGCTIRLRGINYSGLEYNPQGQPAGNMMSGITVAVANWKVNVIRLPINQDYWFGCQGANQGNYRALVQNVVNYCSQNNVYVDLDLQWSGTSGSSTSPCGSGWGTSNTIQDMPDMNSVTFWSSVAQTFGNDPAVLFDLFNEPHDISWSVWRNGGNTGSFNTPGFQNLLTTIRNTGANNAIIVGGLGWSFDLTGVAGNSLTDTGSGNGVIYASHFYPNSANNMNATGWNQYVGAAVNAGHPVIVEEFGPNPSNNCASENDGGGYDNAVISWMDGNNSQGGHLYSGIAWSFIDCPHLTNYYSNGTFGATSWHGAPVSQWIAHLNQTPQPNCGSTPLPTATPTPLPTCSLVSNFENGSLTNNYGGAWGIYSWGAGSTVTNPLVDAATGANGTTHSVKITGTETAADGTTGFGVQTAFPAGFQNWDATFQSLVFWVKTSQAANLRLNLQSPLITDSDHYGFNFTVAANTWTQVTIPKASFARGGWGTMPNPPSLDQVLANLVSLNWQTQNTAYAGLTLWVDEVCMETSALVPPPTSTATPTFSMTQTFTRTPTHTSTPTPTQTNSPSFTSTWTNSFTASSTSTATASRTPTPTVTASFTASATASRTPTDSSTSTGTPSATPTNTSIPPTATRTFTSTPTATFTSTATSTFSGTWTPSFTYTSTASMTPTPTVTASLTVSATASRTPTDSSTSTGTPSATPTNTSIPPTATRTLTPTPTATFTSTATSTFSGTWTPSFTYTSTSVFTDTASPTPTSTNSYTPTVTSTSSSTPTFSASATPTRSATPTSTASFTVTLTETPTWTHSSTHTPTWTSTSSFTPTVTTSSTPSATPTPTWSLTPSATKTATATVTSLKTGGKCDPCIYPNPATGSVVSILPPPYEGFSNVRVELFTANFRKVMDETFYAIPAGTPLTFHLITRWGDPLANGLYYVLVTTQEGRTRMKLLVLR